MRQVDLDIQLAQISAEVKEKKLIRNCITVATTHGEGRAEEHSAHCSSKFKLRRGRLRIDSHQGYTMYGGGHVRVLYDDVSVFKAENRTSPKANFPYADGHVIEVYHPGDWEDEIRGLLRPPRPEKKIKKPEPMVSDETFADLRDRFGDQIA